MKAKKIQYILKRPLAFLLICALLLPTMIIAQAALTTDQDDTAPDVKVVSTLIGGQYLEVGLNIDNKGAGKFQSAGVLLSYNPDMLTPIKWGEVTGEDGAVLEDAKLELKPETDAATAWDKAVILPSKGADTLSGKLAEAFVLKNKGYLYLSAEAARAVDLKQTPPAGTGTVPVGFPTATTSGQGISYIGKAETAADQTTTVRFLVNTKTETPAGGGDPITRLYNLSELASSLDLVTYDGTAGTPNAEAQSLLRYSPLAIDMTAQELAGVSYISDNTDYTIAGYDKAVNLEFVWIQEGQTVNSGGGGSADDFASIVFYDWDGTLLGSIVVPKGEDATGLVNEFAKSLMSPVSRDYSIMSGAEDTAKSYFVDDTNYPMTYKKGYSFLTWIPYDSTEPTSYGDRVVSDNSNNMATDAAGTADVAKKLTAPNIKSDFSNITGSLEVTATYTSNAECSIGSSELNRRYSVEPIEFGRYGTTSNFTIKLEIRRGDVPRIAKPMLRLKMTIGTTTIMSLYELKGKDVETIEIIPFATNTAGVDKIVWSVVDAYGLSNMSVASQRTNEGDTLLQKGTVKNYTFDGSSRAVNMPNANAYMHNCILGGINSALEAYDPSKPITNIKDFNTIILRSIGVSAGSLSADDVKQKLYDKWASINLSNGIKHEVIVNLTRDDMIEALGTQSTSPDLS